MSKVSSVKGLVSCCHVCDIINPKRFSVLNPCTRFRSKAQLSCDKEQCQAAGKH